MKVIKTFVTHHYETEYEPTDMYCPSCGSSGSVWVEQGDGDYYCGSTHICTHCDVVFTIQGPSDATSSEELIIKQLKGEIGIKPATPRGKP